MERKYYLRGLGLGIAMTAIIMGVALPGNKTMTDEEIIARAKELGMVEENTVLSDMDDENMEEDADDGNTDVQDVGRQQEPVEAEPNVPVSDDTVTSENENENEETADLEEDDTTGDGTDEIVDGADDEPEDITSVTDNEETVLPQQQERENDKPQEDANTIITSAAIKTITVNSGDGSYTVARKLADVGVVTSAETFDTFLCQNGYDKRLRTGTFSIPADASDEQIARIVTGAE
ncbi:MAG: hypothetical protein K2J99_03595 [Lachnospiraceae bacterium]|nr:hypothetical protein [Lachnospiraceae bacterium]